MEFVLGAAERLAEVMGDPSNNLLNRVMLSIIWVLYLPVAIYYWLTGKNPNE